MPGALKGAIEQRSREVEKFRDEKGYLRDFLHQIPPSIKVEGNVMRFKGGINQCHNDNWNYVNTYDNVKLSMT